MTLVYFTPEKDTPERQMLYGNGEVVAVSYASSVSTKSVYLGKDVMGSVRSSTTIHLGERL